jgi:hypothetical protein
MSFFIQSSYHGRDYLHSKCHWAACFTTHQFGEWRESAGACTSESPCPGPYPRTSSYLPLIPYVYTYVNYGLVRALSV